jgi:CBS domain-containing protein
MNVGQVMTRDPRTCGQNDSLSQAAQVMWESDCGCVPVVDGDGKAVGMITDRDICMAAYTQGLPLSQMQVKSAASRNLVCVRENDSLETAEGLMQKHQIRRLPVIDTSGRLLGILSMNDLVRRLHVGHRHGDLSSDAIARVLAAICTPAVHATAAE